MKNGLIFVLLVLVALMAIAGRDHAGAQAQIEDTTAPPLRRAAFPQIPEQPLTQPYRVYTLCPVTPWALPEQRPEENPA